jgi:hypothetical protein
MGNSQYCCQYKDKDPHSLNYAAKGITKDGAAPEPNTVKDTEMKALMKLSKENEPKVVKVQAHVRGYLQRKVNKIAKDLVDPRPQLSHRSRDKMPGGKNMAENKGKVVPGNSYARELKEMPDHSNEATRSTEARLG